MQLSEEQREALDFYKRHYDLLGSWITVLGKKQYLGEKDKRECRFCGKGKPEVTFRKQAHVVPQSLGNKTLLSYYECDACNEEFGSGIENDLGNWTKPYRTLARISGQKGVPTLKGGGDADWRIESTQDGLDMHVERGSAPYVVDGKSGQIHFSLPTAPYRPIAVAKALTRIGLTLMPVSEISNFKETLDWVRNQDHTQKLLTTFSIRNTFRPGPARNDFHSAALLRRKPSTAGCPYMFLMLAYGHQTFQFPIPCRAFDQNSSELAIPTFPPPGLKNTETYGEHETVEIDLTNSDLICGEIVKMTMQFETVVPVDKHGGSKRS